MFCVVPVRGSWPGILGVAVVGVVEMTDTDAIWLNMKILEIRRVYAMFGQVAQEWDAPKFIKIISELGRENRRLRTQLEAKI